MVRESVEGGNGGSRYDGDAGLIYDEEEGLRLSLDECDVLEEALNDGRWSEAIALWSVRGTKLKAVKNMQEYCRARVYDTKYAVCRVNCGNECEYVIKNS